MTNLIDIKTELNHAAERVGIYLAVREHFINMVQRNPFIQQHVLYQRLLEAANMTFDEYNFIKNIEQQSIIDTMRGKV